jgi:small ligand-binding sensory domain FIST
MPISNIPTKQNGPHMNALLNNPDLLIFIGSVLVGGSCGWIGHQIGKEAGLDIGFRSGADMTKAQYIKNGWRPIGDGYLVSLKDGSISREIHDIERKPAL